MENCDFTVNHFRVHPSLSLALSTSFSVHVCNFRGWARLVLKRSNVATVKMAFNESLKGLAKFPLRVAEGCFPKLCTALSSKGFFGGKIWHIILYPLSYRILPLTTFIMHSSYVY